MKFIVSVLVTALLAFAMGLYFYWWTIVVASFIVAVLIYQSPGRSFLAGFLAISLLWGGLSWAIDTANHSILAPRVANLFPLGGSVWLLILVTALLGGLAGGLGALSGSLLRRVSGR